MSLILIREYLDASPSSFSNSEYKSVPGDMPLNAHAYHHPVLSSLQNDTYCLLQWDSEFFQLTSRGSSMLNIKRKSHSPALGK